MPGNGKVGERGPIGCDGCTCDKSQSNANWLVYDSKCLVHDKEWVLDQVIKACQPKTDNPQAEFWQETLGAKLAGPLPVQKEAGNRG